MSQYFSNMPRDYPHQQPGKVIPKEITGQVKRLDANSNTHGSWNRLIERTQDFHVCSDPNKQTQYRQRMVEEFMNGRDNIFPDQSGNVQGLTSPSQRKMFSNAASNENNTGGIINQLKRQDTDKYIPHKSISNTLHKQTNESEEAPKNAKKLHQKSEEMYFSQIRGLPGQAYRQPEEVRVNSAVEERNKGIGLLAQRSQIVNLPGSDYGKLPRQSEPTKRNEHLYHVRLLETTPEVYQDRYLVEQNFEKIQPHTIENTKHCKQEYDIVAGSASLKKFPEKKDNLYRMMHEKEVINPNSITGTRKAKAFNDPFHSHFKFG